MTGAMLPSGADRVIKHECTEEADGFMRIVAEDPNHNIRFRGEDLQTGQLVLAGGTRLRAAQIALLASLGLAEVPVAKPPRVGILTTGSELVAPGSPLGPGQDIRQQFPFAGRPAREMRRRAAPSGWSGRQRRGDGPGHRFRPGEMRCADPVRRGLGRRFRLRARRHEAGRLHTALREDRRAAGYADGLRKLRRKGRLRAAGQPGLHFRDLRGFHQAAAAAPVGT